MFASQEPRFSPETVKSAVLARRDVYETLAQDAGFGLRFGDITCFDHQSNELVIGIKQLLSLGVNDIAEVDFAVLHEIKHYLDMRSDPDSYQKLIDKGTRDDGLGELFFKLYNCTEDVAVNIRNAHDSAVYRDETRRGFSALVQDLYREKLFKERDFDAKAPGTSNAQTPLCAQYAQYILNLGMGVGRDIHVASEVRELIKRHIDVYGKSLSLADFVEAYLSPAAPTERLKLGNSLKDRIRMVEEFLEPRFKQLLDLDIARNGQDALKDKAKDLQFGSPAGSSLDDLKEALKRVKSDRAEKAKTPADRARDTERKQQEAAADECGLSPKEKNDFVNRLSRLEPVIEQLSELWLSVPQISVDYQSRYEGHYSTGMRPDMHRLIQRFVDIDQGNLNVPIMERVVEDRIERSAPKRVRVRMVVDASGSMEDKMNTVADLAVALGMSFIRANAVAEIRGMDFVCQSQVVTFGAGTQEILALNDRITLSDLMRAYKSFFAYEDSTSDHLALGLIANGLRPLDKPLREAGELFDVVLELTDGDTSDPESSKRCILNLERDGLICRAIGIGNDLTKFDDIWNGDAKRGEKVDYASQLHAAVQKLLENELNKLRTGMGGGER